MINCLFAGLVVGMGMVAAYRKVNAVTDPPEKQPPLRTIEEVIAPLVRVGRC